MAKFIITEEQFQMLNNNSQDKGTDKLFVNAKDTKSLGQTLNTSTQVGQMNKTAQTSGKKFQISAMVGPDTTVSGTQKPSDANHNPTTGANESRIITKKELTENRFKYLKENSKLYTVKDFLRK